MNAITFDTLKFVERLEAGGFTHSQAKAAAEAFAEATGQELATKSDLGLTKADIQAEIAGLRAELKSDLATLRTEFKSDLATLRTELKTDMESLRTEFKSDMAALKVDFIKWMVGLLFAQTALLLTLLKFVH